MKQKWYCLFKLQNLWVVPHSISLLRVQHIFALVFAIHCSSVLLKLTKMQHVKVIQMISYHIVE